MQRSQAQRALDTWREHYSILDKAVHSIQDTGPANGQMPLIYHIFPDESVLMKDTINSPPLVGVVLPGMPQWRRLHHLLKQKQQQETTKKTEETQQPPPGDLPSFCAIDPGTHTLGLAKFLGEHYRSSTSVTAPDLPLESRITWLIAQLDAITKQWHSVTTLALESTTGMEARRPSPELRAMTRRIEQWARARAWTIVHHHPGSVAASVRLRGMSTKDRKKLIAASVQAIYARHLENRKTRPAQDELDAIAIAHCHASKESADHRQQDGNQQPQAPVPEGKGRPRHKLTRSGYHSSNNAHSSWILHYDLRPIAHIERHGHTWCALSWTQYELLPTTSSHTRAETIAKTLEVMGLR